MGYFKQQNVEIMEFIEEELKKEKPLAATSIFDRFPFLDKNNPNDWQTVGDIMCFVLENLMEEALN